jgi:ribokinase
LEGLSLEQALLCGAAAGAVAVTKAGAQPSLPDRSTFDEFLRQRQNS